MYKLTSVCSMDILPEITENDLVRFETRSYNNDESEAGQERQRKEMTA